MKSIKKRILSAIIALTITLTDSSIAVLAESGANVDAENKAPSETVVKEAYITDELSELRTEYSKTFEKSDGTYVSVVSSVPMHSYNKKKSAWEDFDNTFSQKRNPDGTQVLANNNSDLAVEIPKELNGENEIKVKSENDEISMLPLSTENTTVKTSVPKALKTKSNQNKTIEELVKSSEKSEKAQFDNVLSNTSFEYEKINDSLKEIIKLSKKPEKEESYSFELDTKGLQCSLKDDGAVYINKR